MLRRPLWPPEPPFCFTRTLVEGEVDLVVDHDHLFRRQLVEVGGGGHGLAGEVHVGLGLEDGDLLVGDRRRRPSRP